MVESLGICVGRTGFLTRIQMDSLVSSLRLHSDIHTLRLLNMPSVPVPFSIWKSANLCGSRELRPFNTYTQEPGT